MALNVTFTVTTMVWPPGRLAKSQVKVAPDVPGAGVEQVAPRVLATLWSTMPGARVEVKCTPPAAKDWAFLICQVNVSDAVTAGPPFCAEPTYWRSVVWFRGMTAVVTLAVLLAALGSFAEVTVAWFSV